MDGGSGVVRILYFSKDYSIHDHRFLDALNGTDHEIYYLRLETNSNLEHNLPIPAEINEIRWDLETVDTGDEVSLVQDLGRIINEVGPDVLHAGPVQSCAYLAARTGFGRLLTMSWGSDILMDARTDPGRSKAIFALERSQLLACDCDAVAKVAKDLGMHEERIAIFPWGVDLEFFTPSDSDQIRTRLGWEEAVVLLSTRALEDIYGVEILVEGFIRAAKENQNLRLFMLNEGTSMDRLKQMVASGGMETRVHFAGNVRLNDLPEVYWSSDIYISASRSDGSSISLLESMASGLPAIVSDIPGNREWVEPGLNGWWFADGDPEDLSRTIETALEDRGKWTMFGQRARRIAEARADWRANFQTLLRAYQTVAEKGEELL
jgi:glycosyltransferase involved in cell wall biosynthesis